MNGVIILNKPSGITSRDAVNIVSKKLNTKKVGHTGTLDPLASGVLIVCVGKATKLVDKLVSYKKEYIAEITLGVLTDTLDIEGKILKEEDTCFNELEIKEALDKIKGKYIQEVPIYSAVKVNGKKLYEYAREGKEVILPKREVEIFDIELLNIKYENNKTIIKIKCLVSKGTYIRSLANDIAKNLNTYGIMSYLCRTKQENYCIDDSYTIEDINNDKYKILTIEEVLKDKFRVDMDDELYFKVKNGNKLLNIYNQEEVTFYYNNTIIALYKNINNELKVDIMF